MIFRGDLLFIIEQQQQHNLWECLWKQKIPLRNSYSGYLQYLMLVGQKSFKHILKIYLIALILKISKTSLPYVTWLLCIILSLCNITESISLAIPALAKNKQTHKKAFKLRSQLHKGLVSPFSAWVWFCTNYILNEIEINKIVYLTLCTQASNNSCQRRWNWGNTLKL